LNDSIAPAQPDLTTDPEASMSRRIAALLVLAGGVAAACGTTTRPEAAAILAVSPSSATLVSGDSIDLAVTVLTADRTPLSGVPVTFASSDTAVTMVTPAGRVRARGLGHATIAVRGGAITRSVPVTVIPQPASLEVAPQDTTLRQGDTVQLVAAVRDSQSVLVPGATVVFRSDAAQVVSVTWDGRAQAVAAAGSAVITASLGALRATAIVRAVDTAVVARIKLPEPGFGVTTLGTGTAFVTLPASGRVARLDLGTLELAAMIAAGPLPTSLAVDPAWTRLYVSNQGARTISVVDLATSQIVDTFHVAGEPTPLAVSADGKTLFVATDVHRLYRIDVTAGVAVDSLDLLSTSHCMEFNASRDRLYVATRAAGTVIEVDPAAMTILRTFQVGGFTQELALAGGGELWVGNGSGGVEVWSLGTAVRLAVVPTGPSNVFGLTVGGGDAYLYGTLSPDGKVVVIDRAARAVVHTLATGGVPWQVAYDAATGYVVVANESGWVDVIR
jgi:YVTN family beta-propeller protein